jgi:ankyrin repeat protein
MVCVAALSAGIDVSTLQQPPAGSGREAVERMMAAERGETPEVQALVKGGDPNARDTVHQRTALMWSIVLNDRAAFDRFLAAAAADVNARDDSGETALMFAAQFGATYDTTAMAAALIAKSADVAARTPGQSLTPLMHAANMNAAGVARLILEKLDPKEVDVRNSFGQTALLMAVFVGAAPVVELLLEKGANVEGADPNGQTPLMYAVRGHTEGTDDTVAVLLNGKADVNARDKAGSTPLGEATKAGNTAIAAVLKEAGAR